MASLKATKRLLAIIAYVNFMNKKEGVTITPCLIGKHGNGKTQCVSQVAKKYLTAFENGGKKVDVKDEKTFMNISFGDGQPEVLSRELNNYGSVDCSQTGDGDIAIPFAFEKGDGTREVRYVLHYIFSTVSEIEKEYYLKATTDGFLNGRIKLRIAEDGNEYLTLDGKDYLTRTKFDLKRDGDLNKYRFGRNLPGEIKLELIKQGEIEPYFILLDELNRADMPVMKQMMNVILERNVNGYQLPWWTQIVCAINPAGQETEYATSELDAAQWSRLLGINVQINQDEFIDYGLEAGLNAELLESLSVLPGETFNPMPKFTSPIEDKLSGDPRAWEMVSKILDYFDEAYKSGLFSYEETHDEEGVYQYEKDLESLIAGKVGVTTATTIIAFLKDTSKHVKASEVITLKSPTINKEIAAKIGKMKFLTQKTVCDNVASYVLNNNDEYKKLRSDSKKGVKDTKAKFENLQGQLGAFVALLPKNLRIYFARKLFYGGASEYAFPAFSQDLVEEICNMKESLKQID